MIIPAPPLNALTLGPITIHLYGIIIASAIMLCYLVGKNIAQRKNISTETFETIFLISITSGIVGSRLYHVVTNWKYYSQNLIMIPAIWNGGLGMYGGIATGIISIYVVSKKHTINWKKMTDICVVVLPLGQAIGRWGNYFNQELFGKPTELPWKLYIEKQHRPQQFEKYEYFHPTFLYESIFNLINFAILYTIYTKKQLKPGIITGIYLILYSIIRFILDFIKINPNAHIPTGTLTINQWISIGSACIGIIIIKNAKKQG